MLIERILEEAFQLIEEPGVRAARYVVRVAARGGCSSDRRSGSHSEGTGSAIAGNRSAQFYLYDRQGRPAVHYGGDHVHFDPGSSCLNILDPETRQARPALAADLVKMVEVAEMLPQFAAQSTAMLDNDVPPEIGDWYRLFAGLVAFGKAPGGHRCILGIRACILRHSAACCTTDPTKVTGAVAPAGGMLTTSAGTPARARSTRFCEAKLTSSAAGTDRHRK
jgi:hypothetical protein